MNMISSSVKSPISRRVFNSAALSRYNYSWRFIFLDLVEVYKLIFADCFRILDSVPHTLINVEELTTPYLSEVYKYLRDNRILQVCEVCPFKVNKSIRDFQYTHVAIECDGIYQCYQTYQNCVKYLKNIVIMQTDYCKIYIYELKQHEDRSYPYLHIKYSNDIFDRYFCKVGYANIDIHTYIEEHKKAMRQLAKS